MSLPLAAEDRPVGYYIHHHGSGHLHRALAIAAALDRPVAGLSTLPRPEHWTGDWIQLPDDADPLPSGDVTASGQLHYAPLNHPGLRRRMSAIAGWIGRADPVAFVSDVSVEVALLARLHGVPLVTVALPGHRTDAPHRLGYDLSEAIIAPWPALAGSIWSPTSADLGKTTFVGAVSRFAPVAKPAPSAGRVVVLNGTGGGGPEPGDVTAARAATPTWEWVHLDRAHGTWVDDPWPILCSAAVVVSHTGQNAVAEIAAARRPAVLIPQPRPFDEQHVTAAALARLECVPALVRQRWPGPDEWPALLARASGWDGGGWAAWNDGHGAERAAAVLDGFHPRADAAKVDRPDEERATVPA